MSRAAPAAIGLISNPGSGHNRERFELIRSIVEECPAIHHVVTASAAEIRPALEELARRQVQYLAINGGDGTASAVLGRMLEAGLFPRAPVIILLPGGTANMNAGDVGVRGKLVPAVKRFCSWSANPPPAATGTLERRLLRLQVDGATHFGMFLGAGAVIYGTEYAHREIHARGLRDDFSVALGTARTIWGVVRDDPRFNRHVPVSLRLDDGAAASHDALILAISTLQRLFFGMRPFWGTEPGQLRLTLVEQGCSDFLRTFVSIARGRPNRNAVPGSGYISHNADRVYLGMEGSLNLDGEIIEVRGEAHIDTAGPLRFLRL